MDTISVTKMKETISIYIYIICNNKKNVVNNIDNDIFDYNFCHDGFNPIRRRIFSFLKYIHASSHVKLFIYI